MSSSQRRQTPTATATAAAAAAALLGLLALLPSGVEAGFHLPGVAPKTYQTAENVPLKVNKLSSTKTLTPYEYYDVPFCRPPKRRGDMENLGEVLAGDAITNSPYQLEMKAPKACVKLCRMEYSEKEMKMFRHLIDEEYRIHWILDSLPVAVRNDHYHYISRGFPVGFVTPSNYKEPNVHCLYNHIRIVIKYNENAEHFKGSRIVGFEVVPFSVKHQWDSSGKDAAFSPESTVLDTCNDQKPVKYAPEGFQTVEAAGEVIYTYDVEWKESEVTWAQRWDVYFTGNPDDEIHYFSIVNSLMIVLFLTGVVAMIMLRTLRRDISHYNEVQTVEEAQEESGWKLVHGDVFRPPQFSPLLLAVLAGSGAQLFAMALSTLTFALLGFMSPANRGGLLTSLLLLFVFMGSVAGYASARLYKLLGGKNWKKATLLTATLFPGVIFALFSVLNIISTVEQSSTAVPFVWILCLLVLWLGVSSPLVFVGAYFGFKKDAIEVPVRTNQIARHVPEQQWYTHPLFSVALGGILPFGAVCIELFFIMSALWLHQIYYVFGFLMCVFFILMATCAEITIVMIYFQLCNEDYRWWWRSFLSSGSAALYLIGYSIWYFVSKLDIDTPVSTFIYFTYMSMISIAFFLLTGSIGFFASLWFVRKIYGAIKVD